MCMYSTEYICMYIEYSTVYCTCKQERRSIHPYVRGAMLSMPYLSGEIPTPIRFVVNGGSKDACLGEIHTGDGETVSQLRVSG